MSNWISRRMRCLIAWEAATSAKAKWEQRIILCLGGSEENKANLKLIIEHYGEYISI